MLPRDIEPSAEKTSPLEVGVRVSLEFPDSGTCVAVVAAKDGNVVMLDLLDELPDGDFPAGVALDMFLPRSEGIHHWLCVLRSAPELQRTEIEVLSAPTFVQRRFGHRVEAELQAQVRRIRSARRGRPYEMLVADLSRGGMKLEGPHQLSTGDTLEVTVDLGTPLQVVGRAVMAYPKSEGTWAAHISFLEGQREAIDLVDSYITRQFQRH